MPFEVTASQKDQTLPMILTLRGDEAIVDEFTYDSDQAMAYLGIKRSRLNQISGRELRVARIRRDRYIRPVYRECDLKDYLEWTRATATHLSSSKAIEQAVENLDDRFNDVLQVFNEKLMQVSSEQQNWMRGEFERLPSRLSKSQPYAAEVSREPPLLQSEKVLRQVAHRVGAFAHQFDATDTKILELSGMVEAFIPEMRELNAAQKALRFDFDKRFEAMVGLIRDYQKLMIDHAVHQRDILSELSVRIEELETKLNTDPITHEAPAPRPHSRRPRVNAVALRRYNAE